MTVDSLEQTSTVAKAGIMCRESLDADAANIMILVNPDNSVDMQWRTAAGEITQSIRATGNGEIKRLRLNRRGNLFIGLYSSDGTSWETIGSETVVMDTDVEIGLAATSHHSNRISTVKFSNISFDK